MDLSVTAGALFLFFVFFSLFSFICLLFLLFIICSFEDPFDVQIHERGHRQKDEVA